jgi:hypothetical protein
MRYHYCDTKAVSVLPCTSSWDSHRWSGQSVRRRGVLEADHRQKVEGPGSSTYSGKMSNALSSSTIGMRSNSRAILLASSAVRTADCQRRSIGRSTHCNLISADLRPCPASTPSAGYGLFCQRGSVHDRALTKLLAAYLGHLTDSHGPWNVDLFRAFLFFLLSACLLFRSLWLDYGCLPCGTTMLSSWQLGSRAIAVDQRTARLGELVCSATSPARPIIRLFELGDQSVSLLEPRFRCRVLVLLCISRC